MQRYFSLFSREQIKIYINEDFSTKTLSVLHDICGFLGLDSFSPDIRFKYNVSGSTSKPIPKEIQPQLQEIYREDILKLQNLIGRDLSKWLPRRDRAGVGHPSDSLQKTPNFDAERVTANKAVPSALEKPSQTMPQRATKTLNFTSQLPKVSIIIPCYNAGKRLENCLSSCFQQTYSNIEIIVVDNNSTDGSANEVGRLAAFSPHRLLLLRCHQQEQGTNHARNYGFAHSVGDYIQWLDADDSLAPDKIALQVSALEKNSDCAIAYGDWMWCLYRDAQCISQLAFTSQQYDDYLLQLLIDNWRPPHAYLLPRKAATVLDELNGWNPQTQLAMDREYFTLAALWGFRFLYVPSASVYYNSWSSSQITRRASYGERVLYLKRIFERFQHYAASQPSAHLTEQHKFLLHLPWEKWKLASVAIHPSGESSFQIKNLETHSEIQVNKVAATIVSAMQKYTGAYTLEDHARLIVRVLWKYAVQRNATDLVAAEVELGKLVGVRQRRESQTEEQLELKKEGSISNLASTTCLEALMNHVPLYAPLFGFH